MKIFFRFSLIYLAASLALTASVRDFGVEIVSEAATSALAMAWVLGRRAVWVVPLFLAVSLIMGRQKLTGKMNLIGYAAFGSIIMQVAFSFLKSAIPDMVPFYADPALADFDQWLHGGVAPWITVHGWASGLPVGALLPVYVVGWSFPAFALPLVVALADRDRERGARFLVLYVFCWLGLGNVLAIAGSSVGPVFYDAVFGSDRFAGLSAALAESGVSATQIGQMQGYLWQGYASGDLALGSGISAFPSVHVGVATLTALYLGERSRWLILPGVAFVAVILFLSVYTGYHYAVDGYFSIMAMTMAWVALRRARLSELRLVPGWWRQDALVDGNGTG